MKVDNILKNILKVIFEVVSNLILYKYDYKMKCR